MTDQEILTLCSDAVAMEYTRLEGKEIQEIAKFVLKLADCVRRFPHQEHCECSYPKHFKDPRCTCIKSALPVNLGDSK